MHLIALSTNIGPPPPRLRSTKRGEPVFEEWLRKLHEGFRMQ
jgi:hypothetical protein